MYFRPLNNPIRGPYWGANTPIPVPLLISLTLSKTLRTASTRLYGAEAPQLKLTLRPQIDLEVVRHVTSVLANPAPQAASVGGIGAEQRFPPAIGDTAGSGIELVMVRMNPVVGDVVQLILTEVKLSRYNLFGQTFGAGKIGVCGKIAGVVVAGQLHTLDFSLCIIERGIDQGLAELALVDQVRGLSCRSHQRQRSAAEVIFWITPASK